MENGEGSSSRPTWWTCASSSARPSIFATASTTTEVGEEFEESSNSDPDDVYVASSDDPTCSSGDEFNEWSCWSAICIRHLDSGGHLESHWLFILWMICIALGAILIYATLRGI